jgi:hypothetical protein
MSLSVNLEHWFLSFDFAIILLYIIFPFPPSTAKLLSDFHDRCTDQVHLTYELCANTNDTPPNHTIRQCALTLIVSYCTLQVPLKVLSNEKRGDLKVVAFDRSPFKLFMLRFSNKSMQASSCERLSEPCFCYLKAIIVSQ